MITSIEIENFKGISDRVKIDLAPITLFFGANSVGKSTILQALELFEGILSGNFTNSLGGYVNYVHNHDLSKETIIRITSAIDPKRRWESHVESVWDDSNTSLYRRLRFDSSHYERDMLPEFLETWMPDVFVGDVHHDDDLLENPYPLSMLPIANCLETLAVEIAIRWDPKLSRPFISKFTTSANGESLGELVVDLETDHVFLRNFNFEHGLLPSYFSDSVINSLKLDDRFGLNTYFEDVGNEIETLEITKDGKRELDELEKEQISQKRLSESCNGWLGIAKDVLEEFHSSLDNIPTTLKKHTLRWSVQRGKKGPDVGGFLKPTSPHSVPNAEQLTPEKRFQLCKAYNSFVVYADMAFSQIGRILLDQIQLQVVGPLRNPREFDEDRMKSRKVSDVGLWGGLSHATENELEAVNRWLVDRDHLDTGYKLKIKRTTEFEVDASEWEALEKNPHTTLEDFRMLTKKIKTNQQSLVIDSKWI